MSSLYERLSVEPGGRRALARARLRYRFQSLLHEALERSGLRQNDVARALGFRRSAVNQVMRGSGNLRADTLADYLDAMGYEVRVELVPAGTARSEACGWRSLQPASVRTMGVKKQGAASSAFGRKQYSLFLKIDGLPMARTISSRDDFRAAV